MKKLAMKTLCLKCKKIQKTKIEGFQKLIKTKQCYYQNVLCAAVKDQCLLKK